MFYYYKLSYVLNVNRLLSGLDRMIPGIQEKVETKKFKDNYGIWALYYFFSFLLQWAKNIVVYTLVFPFILSVFTHFWGLNHEYYCYYYVLILSSHLAVRMSKCKVISVDYIEYCFLSIFKISKKHMVKIQKNKCITDMLVQLVSVCFAGVYLGFSQNHILFLLVGMMFVDALGNVISLFVVKRLKTKYVYNKIAIFYSISIFVPIAVVFAFHYSDLFGMSYPWAIFQIVSIVVLYIIFFVVKDYDLYCRSMLQQYYHKNMLLESIDETKIDEKSNIKTTNLANREDVDAFEYFNDIFFQRHKKPIRRSFISRGIFAFAAVTGAALILPRMNLSFNQTALLILPVLLYEVSMSNRLCFLFYTNCDKNMLSHNWYKGTRVQRKMLAKRLNWSLKYNFLLSLTIGVGYMISSNAVDLTFIVMVFLILFAHAIYDNFIYYYLKPYTRDLKVRTPLFYLYKGIYLGILTGVAGLIL